MLQHRFVATSLLLSVAASAGLATGDATAPATIADRIWTGGTILTMSETPGAAPRAEAVAEADGRILFVGSAAEAARFRGPTTESIDLAGRTLLPGFVDPHGHVVMGGLQALAANLLPPPDGGVTDIASLQASLRTWIAANEATVRKVDLIIGFGYDNSLLKELRHPTRDDLDAVSKEIPILVVHQSAHLAALNSRALELCGITADTVAPAGGVIRRVPGSKEPDGVLEEIAFNEAAATLIGRLGPDGIRAFARAGAELWARYGYTTAQEGRAKAGVVEIVRAEAKAKRYDIDIVLYPDVVLDREYILANTSDRYVDGVRVAGAKLSIDGSPQGFTAWRDRPYHAPVGNYPPGYKGYPSVEPEAVVEIVDWCFRNGIQVITHANGEAAGDALIAAIDAATRAHGPADRRPVLIHGQFVRRDQLDAYRRLDVIPALFPMHTYYWGDWHREHTVGPVLAEDISPTGWCVERGMRFTTHHDAPVAFPDSMRVLDATVTRRTRSGDILGPTHRVDVMTALKAMTIWPAYQLFEEREKGSIEVGKLADFVLLDRDPTAVDPETLDQLTVLATIKEGRTIFAKQPAAEARDAAMLRPTHGGRDLFAEFLVAASITRDYALLPEATRLRPFVRQAFEAQGAAARSGSPQPHESACVVDTLDAWIDAMLRATASRGTRASATSAGRSQPSAVEGKRVESGDPAQIDVSLRITPYTP